MSFRYQPLPRHRAPRHAPAEAQANLAAFAETVMPAVRQAAATR
jgi:hypothetical protein